MSWTGSLWRLVGTAVGSCTRAVRRSCRRAPVGTRNSPGSSDCCWCWRTRWWTCWWPRNRQPPTRTTTTLRTTKSWPCRSGTPGATFCRGTPGRFTCGNGTRDSKRLGGGTVVVGAGCTMTAVMVSAVLRDRRGSPGRHFCKTRRVRKRPDGARGAVVRIALINIYIYMFRCRFSCEWPSTADTPPGDSHSRKTVARGSLLIKICSFAIAR